MLKKVLFLLVVWIIFAIAIPMESLNEYNLVLVHGAYGSKKGFSADTSLPEAYNAGGALENGATLGGYTNDERITQWLSSEIFEEAGWKDNKEYVHNSYVFNWRSFSKPANSSVNNARELGYRQWNSDGTYGKRRALVEEAQEVKASLKVNRNGQDSLYTGQAALDTIRKNPDLYRQIASRYILIGHSMGGVVSREYVQNSDYYHGDVDKIITLDSPHEGTGALNMQIKNEARGYLIYDQMASTLATGVTTMGLTAVPLLLSFKAENLARRWPQGCSRLFCLLARWLRRKRCFRKSSMRPVPTRRRSS